MFVSIKECFCMQASTLRDRIDDQPNNLIIFIRNQMKPEDLRLPGDWADENMQTPQWL